MCQPQMFYQPEPYQTNGYDDDHTGGEIETSMNGCPWRDWPYYDFPKESLPF